MGTSLWASRFTASGSVAEVAKVRRAPTRCQYRRMAQAVDVLGCRHRPLVEANAATMAWGGQPWASNVTTRVMVSAEVRNR